MKKLILIFVVAVLLGGMLITSHSLGTLTTSNNLVSAANSVGVESQRNVQGFSYLFKDRMHGTQLYINTGSKVYRFSASDGYDIGTVHPN